MKNLSMVILLCLFLMYIVCGNVAAACDCTVCHGQMHNNCADWGSNECSSCHGDPPSINGLGQNGLVQFPSPTGYPVAGGHQILAHKYGGDNSCQRCHFGGMPISPITTFGVLHIGINVPGFSGAGSSYDGLPLNAPFSYQGTNGTVVTANGTDKCS